MPGTPSVSVSNRREASGEAVIARLRFICPAPLAVRVEPAAQGKLNAVQSPP